MRDADDRRRENKKGWIAINVSKVELHGVADKGGLMNIEYVFDVIGGKRKDRESLIKLEQFKSVRECGGRK